MAFNTPNGKVAIVTGGGTGIGKAAAIALLRDGWRVAIAGRRKEPLEQVATEADAPGSALAVPTDVTDPAAVEALFAATVKAWGRVDLLFNNAGMGAPAVPMEDLPIDKFREVVNINLVAMFMCTQHAIRIMKAQDPKGGRIINNGSLSAYAPRPMSVAYTATKHAVTGLTKSISLDGRKDDITASQIDNGNALTELAAGMTNGEPMMDAQHAGDAVLHMANLPLDVNVQFMTIMATKMPFVGRG